MPGRTVVTTTATTSLYSLLQTHCSLSLPRLYGNEKDKMSRHLILRRNGELRALRAMTVSLRAIIITFLSSPCRPGGWSQCRHRSEVPAGTTCLHRNSKDTESETRGVRHGDFMSTNLWLLCGFAMFTRPLSMTRARQLGSIRPDHDCQIYLIKSNSSSRFTNYLLAGNIQTMSR